MNRHRSKLSAGRSWLLGALTLALGLGCLPAAEPAATNLTTSATDTTTATNAVQVAESAAPTAPAALGRDFASFQLVAQRNIFNPFRSRRTSGSDGDADKPAPRVEIIALSGTMSYPKGTFAFFDSANADFKKVLKAGEAIAGYTVKEIAPSHIQLEKESVLLELKVGQQLRREEEGAWEVTTGSSFSSSSSSGASGSSSSSASASGEGPSDALKRLLEQRKKENNP